jgi:hypothetical protein
VGVNTKWFNDLQTLLSKSDIVWEIIPHHDFILLSAVGHQLMINCISLLNNFDPNQLLAIQDNYIRQGILLVQLWEDVWTTKPAQVLNRLHSLLGKNRRIHGRKTVIVQLDKKQSDSFLLEHHIQGPVLARYKFGLQYENELVAVATFSATRLMNNKASGYRSSEMIRFASKQGYTVTGGLTKLLKHFAVFAKTNDIMSYADRDWSTGKGYQSAGFTLESLVPPLFLWFDPVTNKRYLPQRIPGNTAVDDPAQTAVALGFFKVFNTGSLKYILYL